MFTNLHKQDVAPLVLRLGLAAIFLLDGMIKCLQAGGTDWHKELPEAVQALVAWGELVGGLALAFGLLTRVVAVGCLVIMVGAIIMVTSEQTLLAVDRAAPAEGGHLILKVTSYEYLLNLAMAVMCLSLVLEGSGRLSVDHCIWGRRKDEPSSAQAPVPASEVPRSQAQAGSS